MRSLKSFPQKRLFTRHFISPLTPITSSNRNFTKKYHKRLQLSLVISLLTLVIFFQLSPKKLYLGAEHFEIENLEFIVEDVPPTEQITKAPPPPRPSVPIPVDDDEIPEDLTISETILDFDEIPPPPPPLAEPEEDGYRFIAYDSPPQPIGGFASLQKYLEYPKIAVMSGIEGRVMLGVLVDTEGKSTKVQILKDSGTNVGFEEAAQKAVLKMKWIPAKQRDKPIKVWVSVPVYFKLRNT